MRSSKAARRTWIVSTALSAALVSGATVGIGSASAAPNCVDYTYRLGSQSGCVKFLQILGNYFEYGIGPGISVDGKFGPATFGLVLSIDLAGRNFIGARVDGVAERQTWYLVCNPQKGPSPANVGRAWIAAGCAKTTYWYHP